VKHQVQNRTLEVARSIRVGSTKLHQIFRPPRWRPESPLGDKLGAAGQQCSEQALRSVVVGHKNHYGSYSKRGAGVAAICDTLLERTKLAGADPHAYLLDATRRALSRLPKTT
jgi:hypothetical protein